MIAAMVILVVVSASVPELKDIERLEAKLQEINEDKESL